ncbi:hypothetical protein Bca52824_048064 [Brassica carinata]|uniref:Uncharacterized protein n=1 Tax=Brassica carinata TaxID=52824 RepID=A0A8X7RKH2_BRACI|nr:hypothetical protein Bca52824_048064 [Brassica carinata]
MDPNQTSGTTPSGINDIDLIGSNSPAGVTPVGLTGTTDATGTTPMQHIPPIGTSIWNRPGKKPPSDDPTRPQSRPISPTLIDEIQSQHPTYKVPDCSAPQRSQAPDPDFTREKIWNDPHCRASPTEPRTRISPSNLSVPENRTPSAARTFRQAWLDYLIKQTRRHDLRGPINIDPQSETGTFQNYIERKDAELKRIHAIVHMATSSAPDIDMVIEETRRTPFTNRIASAKISHPNEVVALAALKNGVWFSSKFREELAVRTLMSLDDALHRASYFTTHEEEVAVLKEHCWGQKRANKNNAIKKPATPKEPTTKGQHSYSVNNSPQKSSTYDLSKYCAFHDRKGHSTEECRAALRNQNENKKTNEEAKEEEEPMTPKSNRKAKSPTNKQGREIEQESPSSPPPAPNKRVDMISWGQNGNSTYETKSQTDEDTPPPQVMKYNPNTRPPSMRFSNFK